MARACEVNPNVLHRWRRELQDYGAKAFAGNGQRRAEESRVAELERKVGRQALEIDFLQRCLQHVEEQRKLQALDYPRLVYPYLEKEMKSGDADSGGTAVRAGAGQPGGILPLAGRAAGDGRGPGSARRDPADRAGVALAMAGGASRRNCSAAAGSEPQTRAPDHARGQSAVPAAAEVRGVPRIRITTGRCIRTWRAAWC